MERLVPSTVQSLFEELKRRRVVRSLLAYAAAVFALLQGAQPVFDGLLLPDFAFRVLVILALTGFPVVFVLAWVYELTADGIRRTRDAAVSSPDSRARIPLRRWLQVGSLFLMVSVLAAFTAAGLGRLRFPAAAPDGRVGLAIFPFRVAGDADPAWSEGAADLLATALDGTVGLRVVDPWSLWRPLRSRRDAPAEAPEHAQAAEITERVDAQRFLLVSVVPGGDRVDVNVRVYQLGRAEPIATFAVSGAETAMAEVVRDAAVGVLTRVWGPSRPPNLPAELDFDATGSPEAMKAYVAAKEALRRGNLDSANTAIDRAIALDSTFVLALVDAVTIKSWGSFARGQPYAGFFPLLERAEAFADSLNPRTRLRLQSMRASVETDGARADDAARRILEIDPQDLAAHSSLAYYQMVYGWQYGLDPFVSGRDQAERVVQLDSGSLTALASRAYWAVALADTADQRAQLERLSRADTTAALGRRWLTALRASLADDAAFHDMLPALVALPAADRIAIVRVLRTNQPVRAAAYYNALRLSTDPLAGALGDGEMARLAIARGDAARVDSAISAGAFQRNATFRTLQAHIVAASLAGISDTAVTRRTADRLADYITPDSALAHFESRPIWWFGWLIGAYYATSGDTTVTRRWIDAIGTLPAGGSPREYRAALQADLRARLAVRAGDMRSALDEARAALSLWSIHTENQPEAWPEPAMRFHLAMLHLQAAQPDSAYALFSSLVPPTTWMGYLTARASFELGDIALSRGDAGMAAFHYTRALRLWEGAGPGATEWLARVRERLTSIVRG
jgi:hypothetical protein